MEKNKALVIGVIVLGFTTAFLGGYVIANASSNHSAAQSQPQVAASRATQSQGQPAVVSAASSGAAEQKAAPAAASASVQQGDDIGEKKAQEVALAHAGLAQAEVLFVRTALDREDGKTVYEVGFCHNTTEYDYCIDAANGAVLGYDYDANGHHKGHHRVAQTNTIGEDAAKNAALQHAGFSESQVQMKRIRLDQDDGVMVYDVKFWKDTTEYDYEIDAINGAVISYEVGA